MKGKDYALFAERIWEYEKVAHQSADYIWHTCSLLKTYKQHKIRLTKFPVIVDAFSVEVLSGNVTILNTASKFNKSFTCINVEQ